MKSLWHLKGFQTMQTVIQEMREQQTIGTMELNIVAREGEPFQHEDNLRRMVPSGQVYIELKGESTGFIGFWARYNEIEDENDRRERREWIEGLEKKERDERLREYSKGMRERGI